MSQSSAGSRRSIASVTGRKLVSSPATLIPVRPAAPAAAAGAALASAARKASDIVPVATLPIVTVEAAVNALGARRGAVRVQQERGEVHVALRAEAARYRGRRRHRHAQERDELLRRAAAPGAHEVGADQRPRLVRAAQIREMAAGAIREIRRSACGGLRFRERARLSMRGGREAERRGGETGTRAASADHGTSHPQRLPSGAVSLWIWR